MSDYADSKIQNLSMTGRLEATTHLVGGVPSLIQPNRLSPLNEISFEDTKRLTVEEKVLRFEQWCYYYTYHLGLKAGDAIDMALENDEFMWLLKNLRVSRGKDPYEWYHPKNNRGEKQRTLGYERMTRYADRYHEWLRNQAEFNHLDLKNLQGRSIHRALALIVSKMETEGIDQISIPDLTSLMKQQSALYGLNSPNRVEVSAKTVSITAEDLFTADTAIEHFERDLLGDGGNVVEGDTDG